MPQLEVMPPDGQQPSLTLADMARQTHLAESTARYYCKRFAAFIPVNGEGRRRRYTADALDVMRAIAENMTTLRSASAVEEVLERRFPRLVTPQPPAPVPAASVAVAAVPASGESAAYMAQQTKALQVIALTLNKMSTQQDTLQAIVAANTALQEENSALKQEIQNMKELLRTAEKMHQEDLQQIRDWMGRLMRKPTPPQG